MKKAEAFIILRCLSDSLVFQAFPDSVKGNCSDNYKTGLNTEWLEHILCNGKDAIKQVTADNIKPFLTEMDRSEFKNKEKYGMAQEI